MNKHDVSFRLAAIVAATLLAACGGGDDASTTGTAGTPTPSGSGSTTVTAAPLVISAATPSTLNGTLDKTAAAIESGSSNSTMGTFASTDDHCRVGAYNLKNSGDGVVYYVEISFRKDTKAVGLLNFGTGVQTTLARAAGPLAGVSVDTTNRRIGFSNVALTSTSTSVTLNGSLEYITNVDPANRAACG